MLIIPAIDLKDGQCVRLRQGDMDDSTVFSDDPVAVARRWVEQGARRLHLVDLNGAFAGRPVNGEVVATIAAAYPELPIQIGGGIRSADTIEYYLQAGVRYLIIGTKAVKEPEFVTQVCRDFKGHIIVGLDAKDGLVATDGWAEVSALKAADLETMLAEAALAWAIMAGNAPAGGLMPVGIPASVVAISRPRFRSPITPIRTVSLAEARAIPPAMPTTRQPWMRAICATTLPTAPAGTADRGSAGAHSGCGRHDGTASAMSRLRSAGVA